MNEKKIKEETKQNNDFEFDWEQVETPQEIIEKTMNKPMFTAEQIEELLNAGGTSNKTDDAAGRTGRAKTRAEKRAARKSRKARERADRKSGRRFGRSKDRADEASVGKHDIVTKADDVSAETVDVAEKAEMPQAPTDKVKPEPAVAAVIDDAADQTDEAIAELAEALKKTEKAPDPSDEESAEKAAAVKAEEVLDEPAESVDEVESDNAEVREDAAIETEEPTDVVANGAAKAGDILAESAATDDSKAAKPDTTDKSSKKSKKKSKEKPEKKKGFVRRHKILTAFICLILIGMIGAAACVIMTAKSVGRIDPEHIYEKIEQTSTLYDNMGNEIDTLHYNEDRKLVSISDMPENLKNAFIAIEDKTFYKHHGFNFKRIFGALLSSIKNDTSISGTSTITQQLARNAYLADIKSQRSIRRKLSEMYIAWRIEQTLTKDEILEAYLNTIYLGYGSYGVNAAASRYFSKNVKDLTLEECAALAALPQAPDTYALLRSEGGEHCQPIEGTELYANDISKDRRDLVLDLMAEQRFITAQEARYAKVDIIDLLKPHFEEPDPKFTYFTDYVADAVVADLMTTYDLSEEEAERMVFAGGLKIHTTIDSNIQGIICTEFEDDYNFPWAIDGSEVQASMVITEVGTGSIVAMVGGRNASGSRLFNRATSPRQPGSSIKPLSVYGAALQRSYELASQNKPYPFIDYDNDKQRLRWWGDYITAGSIVVDEPLEMDGEKWPQNVTRRYSGWNTLRTAVQQSINTCAVKVLLQVTYDYSIEMLEKFGITTVVTDTSQPVNDVNPAALGLGAMTYGVTPLEMSLAYGAFPNGGVRCSAVCYSTVYDMDGNVILHGASERTRVMDEGVAWIMTDILESVVTRGGGGNAAIWGVSVAGKTGTTNDRYDIWFDGFTPDYSASLWVGTDLNVEMTTGSWKAAYLWGKIMRQIPGIDDDDFREMPDDVVQYRGEYYTKGTEPQRGY